MEAMARSRRIGWTDMGMVQVGLLAMRMVVLGTVLGSWEAVEAVGVNWGTISYNPLPTSVVVGLLKDNNLNKVKLFDADPHVIGSMAGTNIEVMVAAPNEMLATLAGSADAAAAWVKENVTQYLGGGSSGVNIKYAAVGNEPFLNGYAGKYQDVALPALKNVQAALQAAGHADTVKAVMPCNADILSSATLPSQATFRTDLAPLMLQIAAFLDSTGAPFVVNLYPFLSLVLGTNFPLDFAFFEGYAYPIMDGTRVYSNVFDASYDGLVSALSAAGYPNMQVVVGEIGWPTDGTPYANITLSQKFNQQLVNHLESGTGTPLRPGVKIEGYLFSLLDEDAKSILPGPFERHWGVFNYDGSVKYTLDLTGGASGTQTKLVAAQNVPYFSNQWCVVNPTADLTLLPANVDYACQHGDCTPLLPGGSCSSLSVQANASYAFNNYYQFNNQSSAACDFQGLAQVTTTDPSAGTCKFVVGVQSNVLLSPTSASTGSGTPKSSASGRLLGRAGGNALRTLISLIAVTAVTCSSSFM